MISIPILIYHAISPGKSSAEIKAGGDGSYDVSAEGFSQQLSMLKDKGYCGILLDDYVAANRNSGRADFHDGNLESSVILTFDDGHASNYTRALPILQEHGFPATFFITVSNIGSPDGMTWQQLRQMADEGMSIQSHTMTHAFLSDLEPEKIEWELAESKSILEDKLGRPVEYLALPGGRGNSVVRRIAKQTGYQALCTSRVGKNTLDSDLYELRRWLIKGSMDISAYESIVRMKRSFVARQRTKYLLLACLKKVLGNQRYHAVWERLH